MPDRIAGIDVHKKMLAVVVADVEVDGDFHFARQKVRPRRLTSLGRHSTQRAARSNLKQDHTGGAPRAPTTEPSTSAPHLIAHTVCGAPADGFDPLQSFSHIKRDCCA